MAYYAYASADAYHDAGSVYAFEGVSVNKVHEAIKVTMGEFERIRDGKGLTGAKVRRAKEYAVGKTTLDLEDSASVANLYVKRALLEDVVEPVEAILERIRAVTLDDVKRVAERIVDFDKLNLAVVGPYKKAEKFGGLVGAE